MNFFKTPYASPLGTMQLTCSDEALCELRFLTETETGAQTEPNDLLKNAVGELDAYFSGSRQLFQIPIAQPGTAFQIKVWRLLQDIPYGRTVSYMDLSKKFGDVKAIRAVASANGKNNIAIIVPCHRVIGTDQSLTGYAGGLWRKQWLLAHEAKWGNGVQQLF